ncbi:MAG: type transport system ATP-binding protein, partial [Solirubrobacteraceae bacterium]|nr:type transport system ATP-binding protein [Solirubrobacteraceae bacterium]
MKGTVRTHPKRLATAAATALAVLLCAPADALARDINVRSFDGITIRAHFYPASNRAVNERVPTVLIGPGYPTLGDTNPDGDTSDQIGQRTLRAEGYNTLTWDPRGIGGSGGTVQFDSPDFEARDVQALIDFVATAPEALQDAPNDPRVGMSGSSYGGAIQLATAAIDSRLDALVPDLAWHNLGTGFFPEGAMKTFFAVSICGKRPETSHVPGSLLGPAAALLDRAAPPIKNACLESLGGNVSPASRQFYIDRTPPGLRERVSTPTLLTQGTVDTFFGPSEAVANYRTLRSRGVPVKMLWHCGGHGRCTTSTGEEGHLRRAGLTWLNRYLKRNEAIDTGARFEWLADDGVWRSGPDYPLPAAGTIEASGANFKSLGISLVDSTASGTDGVAATPAPNAVTVGFAAPPPGSDIVGAPRLKLTYKGNAVDPNTFLYAQIVDGRANRVIGSQVTPLPVILDDRVHTVERDLQAIAAHAGADERYRLQITPGTGVFGPQLSVGGVVLQKVDATLPLVTAGSGARRTPRALVLKVSSRRAGGRARVTISTRLRTTPCSGTVTFTVTAAGRRTRSTATVP